MTPTTDLHKLSATDVVRLLKERLLVEAAAHRIQASDPGINAVPIRCFDQARAKAARWEDSAHKSRPGYLYGLPILVKDLTAVKGLPFTLGSRIYKDNIAATNDPLVDVLEDSGAIVLGKTNTPEFGAGANTFNDVFGKTCNPWDTNLTSGGSSGGSAAALAAGQVWLATGTDLGGSLRIPASFCGVVGLRPSVGRVPQNFYGEASSVGELGVHSVSGPLARNVPDLALFLDAMAHHHPSDPLSRQPPEVSFSEAIQPGKWPLPSRVAWSPNLGIAPVDPEVATICEQAAGWFASMGAELVHDCPELHDAVDIFQVLRAAVMAADPAGGAHMRDPGRSLLKPELIWQYEKGFSQTPEEVARAKHAHKHYVQRVLDFMTRFDLLCCPCVMVAPFDVDIRWIQEVQGTKFSNYVDWLMMTYAFSLVDVPAISVPCGMTTDGCPVGLQIVGRPQHDAALLAAAAAFEKAHPFAGMVPIQPNEGT
ncbi:hypothetical protein ABBQ32_008965 [Trebouxia sp. C0010 RCD-2024]